MMLSDTPSPGSHVEVDDRPSSPSTCLVVTGTAPAAWCEEWQLQAQQFACSVDLLTLEGLMDRWVQAPMTKAVVIVASPATVLAREAIRQTRSGEGVDEEAILNAWSAQARQLVRIARLSHTRCKFIAEEDLWAGPLAVMQAIGEWASGHAWPVPKADDTESLICLGGAAAQRRWLADSSVCILHEELLACCEVFPSAGRGSDDWSSWLNVMTENARRAEQLSDAATARERAVVENRALLDHLHGAQEELEATLRALAQEREQGALDRHRDLERLHLAQEELERALLALQAKETESQAQRAMASKSADDAAARIQALQQAVSAAESTRQDLQSRLQQLQQDLEGLRSRLSEREAELNRVKQGDARRLAEVNHLQDHLFSAQEQLEQALIERASFEPVRSELLRQEAEARHLLERLHDQQEEVERLALISEASYGPAALIRRAAAPRLQGRSPVFVDQHLEGVHRHLTVRWTGALLDGVEVGDVRLRLVEHEGRPGLCLFSSPQDAPLLSAWQTSGHEEAADYMLLVPTDVAGRDRLSRLGTSDWSVVLDAATLLTTELPVHADVSWSQVAARLCRSLADLPARLRYDSIDVNARRDAPDTLVASFVHVLHGARFFPQLTLSWVPEGDRLSLHVEPGDTLYPLSAWPISKEGIAAREWLLPVGSALTGAEKREIWQRLSEEDRASLIALLDALPAVAVAAAQASVTADLKRMATAERAAGLLKEVHHMRRSLALRHRVQRLIHRAQ